MPDQLFPTDGAPIDPNTARQWIANFRASHPNPNEILAHFFGRNLILQILNQPDCVGIRIYHAHDNGNNKHVILVGAKASGENILPAAGAAPTANDGIAGDQSKQCPPYC